MDSMPPPAIDTRVPWAASPRGLALWRALLAVLMGVVCWLAFDPHPPARIDTGWDKLNHLLAFVTLTLCTMLAGQTWRQRWGFSALAMFCFGAFIELVQSQIPGRSGEWPDLLADALGIVLARLLVVPIDRLLRLR
jgi:VanZ family protein